MDLRRFTMSEDQLAFGRQCLAYQPFRLTDTFQTGVGHSWLHASESLQALNDPKLRFDAAEDAPALWAQGVAANEMLARTYERFLEVIVGACPGGSYLDVGCNSGWFPVNASLRGMKRPMGLDTWDYSRSMGFLNQVTGADAAFVRGRYTPREHRLEAPFEGPSFDVVSSMVVLVHVPDPLHMLKALADLAKQAVFLWSAFPRSEELLIRYGKPNQVSGEYFPWGFDAGTAISDSLLLLSMRELGFPHHTEVALGPDDWPAEWDNPLMAPYQPLRAFLFTRASARA